MAKRVCPVPGCPTLVEAGAYRGLCDQHRRELNRARGTSTERGYGADHQAEKRRGEALIEAGALVLCCRCPEPILPGQRFSPDHTDDRAGYRGFSHEQCNLSAAGKASHGL